MSVCLYPLTPHFYIVQLGFKGVYFLFLLQNIDCGYSLETPQCVPKINVLSKNKTKYKKNNLKMNIFTAVKYCCILHGHVCVMEHRLVYSLGLTFMKSM